MRKAKKATKLNHEEPTILHPARWPIGEKNYRIQNRFKVLGIFNFQKLNIALQCFLYNIHHTFI